MELSQFELVDITATNETVRHDAGGITTILTMTTLSFTGRGAVSKAATTTALDWFQIICFAYVFASLVEYAGVNFVDYYQLNLANRRAKEEEERIKKKSKSNTNAVAKAAARMMVATAVTSPEGHTGSTSACIEDIEIDEMESLTSLRRSGAGGVDGMMLGGVDCMTDEEEECEDEEEEDGETRCVCGRFMWRCKVRCERRPVLDQYGNVAAAIGGRLWPKLDPQEESRLDNLSRVAFPLSFLIMNLFYWFSYLYYMPALME